MNLTQIDHAVAALKQAQQQLEDATAARNDVQQKRRDVSFMLNNTPLNIPISATLRAAIADELQFNVDRAHAAVRSAQRRLLSVVNNTELLQNDVMYIEIPVQWRLGFTPSPQLRIRVEVSHPLLVAPAQLVAASQSALYVMVSLPFDSTDEEKARIDAEALFTFTDKLNLLEPDTATPRRILREVPEDAARIFIVSSVLA